MPYPERGHFMRFTTGEQQKEKIIELVLDEGALAF
jgi:hypothetical protein